MDSAASTMMVDSAVAAVPALDVELSIVMTMKLVEGEEV